MICPIYLYDSYFLLSPGGGAGNGEVGGGGGGGAGEVWKELGFCYSFVPKVHCM